MSHKNKKKKSAEGAAAKADGSTGKKRKLSTTELEVDAQIMKEWQEEMQQEKAAKKRVYAKAYHAAFTLARREGSGAEKAKKLARKAGADATLAWAENGKPCE